MSRTEPTGQITSSADPALHVFAVDTVFKGAAHEEQAVLSPMSGASCGLELGGNGPFVVFATRSGDLGGPSFAGLGDQYAAFLCGGTAPATDDLEAELRALAGPPASGPPASGPPVPGDDGSADAPPGAVGPGATYDPGLPTPALTAGALTVVLLGWLLLRRRAAARRDAAPVP